MNRLWAITSFFNPAGFNSRLANYRVFRERLGIPLLTVEMTFDGNFALNSDDCDILLQLRGEDVMWQKECLLNLAVNRLPAECDLVAWIDCDVVFEAPDWDVALTEALDQYALVHLFDHRVNLPCDIDARGRVGRSSGGNFVRNIQTGKR